MIDPAIQEFETFLNFELINCQDQPDDDASSSCDENVNNFVKPSPKHLPSVRITKSQVAKKSTKTTLTITLN